MQQQTIVSIRNLSKVYRQGEMEIAALDDVSAHAGKPVRLRFEMSDADLFAIQFSGK